MKYVLFPLIMLFIPLMRLQAEKTEQTLLMIKPKAVQDHHVGEIISCVEKAGLNIAAIKLVQLTKAQALEFYKEHKGKPFYEDLSEFMSSGSIVVLILEGREAITKARELIGATDPSQAKPGTIRFAFAKSKQCNAVHGSDSPSAAKQEIAFFFEKKQ